MSIDDRHTEPFSRGAAQCDVPDVDLYLDGELPSNREADLFRHLSSCGSCRAYLNGVLDFRRASRDEFVNVPPWADDVLMARVEAQRRSTARTARLHTRDPFWSASTTVSVRTAVLLLCAILVSTFLFAGSHKGDAGYVYFEQEYVRFDNLWQQAGSEIYVFYPGLTIEAERDAS